MKIKHLQIKNILGIESLEFSPGKITRIGGQNGTGKTSFLEGLKGAVGGGHDATLLRNGAKEGQIVLDFDNGEKLIKKINQSKSKAVVKDSDGRELKQSATYIRDIIDPFSVNPIQLLTAKSKDRVDILLEAVPMKLPVEEIKLITGLVAEDDGRHPLKIIDEKRKMIFEDRAYCNKEISKLNTMIEEMRKSIPFDPDKKKWDEEVKYLRGELEKIKADEGNTVTEKSNALQKKVDEAKDAAQKSVDEIRAELSRQIESFQNKTQKELDELGRVTSPKIESLTAEIAKADVNAKNQAGISGAIAFIEKHNKEVVLQDDQAKSYTTQIRSLDALKIELLQNLPVKDLEIKDGEIIIGGVPFDTLNEAARIRFALMIAGLKKAKFPFVCMDGMEALDKDTQAVFIEEADKTDMQYFIAEVTESKTLVYS